MVVLKCFPYTPQYVILQVNINQICMPILLLHIQRFVMLLGILITENRISDGLSNHTNHSINIFIKTDA